MHLSDEEFERLARITRFTQPLGRYSGTGEPFTGEPFGAVKFEQGPETGVYIFPYAVYPAVFYEFRAQLIADGWLEGPYTQEEGLRHMRNRELLGRTDLPTLQRLLLFCDRGERFCDGFWKEAVESGFVAGILHRLEVIRRQSQGGSA
jgi:hypothetical protein